MSDVAFGGVRLDEPLGLNDFLGCCEWLPWVLCEVLPILIVFNISIHLADFWVVYDYASILRLVLVIIVINISYGWKRIRDIDRAVFVVIILLMFSLIFSIIISFVFILIFSSITRMFAWRVIIDYVWTPYFSGMWLSTSMLRQRVVPWGRGFVMMILHNGILKES